MFSHLVLPVFIAASLLLAAAIHNRGSAEFSIENEARHSVDAMIDRAGCDALSSRARTAAHRQDGFASRRISTICGAINQ